MGGFLSGVFHRVTPEIRLVRQDGQKIIVQKKFA
jgi:hypothetical protein